MFEERNGFRWTKGDARLPAALFSGMLRAGELNLEIARAARYQLVGAAVLAADA